MPRQASAASSASSPKSGGAEAQREPIHAITQAGGLRPVVEDMAEVPATARAQDLGALDHQASVGAGYDRARQRLPEARPAGAAFELRRRAEQGQRAPGADECAAAMFVQKRAGEGPLGRRLAKH